ncbi:hypothetical protein N7495_009091 [Penicillium taxi]|uniref:uncharacterized protein n=1 Tax=Penicillium taxi TaxID=168475 RepID=UPI0025457456|nr:uncharacterized protein N7495_009091 [Penicillium taxi]KAJ5889050.1 hypothetical protein N7495_009091 [Penicillium taxi]
MMLNHHYISSSPTETNAAMEAVFSDQPPIFILPTHLSLDQLHEAESRLVCHGGNLTYDINEAGLILGKITHKKRAALELRSRGIWTEDASPSAVKIIKTNCERPAKRQRTGHSTVNALQGIEIIDLSTEYEEDEISTADRAGILSLLKLEWLDLSIKDGKRLPYDEFVVYIGRKTVCPIDVPKLQNNSSNQIIQRAKDDGAQVVLGSNKRRVRHPKNLPGETRKPRPTLYRETTSENDDEAIPLKPYWVRNQVILSCMRSSYLDAPNSEFISQLVKVRRIRELTLDEIGVRAYSTSIAALAAYPCVIKRPREIASLPGCDSKIANLFAEFQHEDNGITAAAALENDPELHVINSFYQIWGVGAKTARDFYNRGWRDLNDVIEHGWPSLSRVQQIGVKFYDEFQEGIPRAQSEAIAAVVQRHVNRVRPEATNIDCIIVGGYRRGKQSGGDVDILLTHRDDAVTRNLIFDLVASLEKDLYITHTLSVHLASSQHEKHTLPFRGKDTESHFDTLDKALVVWQDPQFEYSGSTENEDCSSRRNRNIHRRVDIIISPWQTIGCAVLGWTGDTTFQRDLRRYAKKVHDWKFDSTGVQSRSAVGEIIDLEKGGQTWEERERMVMERIGIGWRPPEERCTR